MPIHVHAREDEAVSMRREATGEQNVLTRSASAPECDCPRDQHSHEHTNHHRVSWLSSRLGQAISKGLGFSAISALVFMPCPCCGGVILACLRGLLSAAIGLGVGVIAYRPWATAAPPDRSDLSSDAASEPN